MPGRIAQAGDWEFIDAAITKTLTRSTKGIRVDQAGTVDITPENVASSPGTANCLQGELINIQGKVTINGGSTSARLQVFY
jgi:hypothetical protein